MWRAVVLFLVLSGWATIACENDPPVKTVAAASCACDPSVSDPFEEPVKFGFGQFKGQCVETCKFRSSRKLSEAGGRQVVTNFLHNKRFWTASIPVDGVEKVDVNFERFAPKISHVFLRFRFAADKPVILTSQTGEREVVKLYDMIVSPEGVPARGNHYTMVNGLLNDYLLTYRLMSSEQFYLVSYTELKHQTSQYRLKIDSAAERRRILEAGLNASRTRAFHEVYNLVSNNCATSVLDLVYGDKAKGKSIEGALPLDMFFGTLSELVRKGMIKGAQGPGLPNMEQEMNL